MLKRLLFPVNHYYYFGIWWNFFKFINQIALLKSDRYIWNQVSYIEILSQKSDQKNKEAWDESDIWAVKSSL